MKLVKCPACKNENDSFQETCHSCGFPFKGTDKEKSIHIGQFIGKKGVIQDSEANLDKSQNLLYFVVILNVVGIFINYELFFQGEFNMLKIISLIIAFGIPAIILMSALLIKRAPLIFLSIPLILMSVVYLFEFIMAPSEWYRGILLKLFVLGLLGYSLYNYMASQRFKKKYNVK